MKRLQIINQMKLKTLSLKFARHSNPKIIHFLRPVRGNLCFFAKNVFVSTEQNVDNQTTLPFMHSHCFGKIFSWMHNFVQQAKKCRRKSATISWLIKRPCCSAPWGQNVSTLCRTLFCIAKLVFQRAAGAIPSDFSVEIFVHWQIYCVTRLHLLFLNSQDFCHLERILFSNRFLF